MGRPIFKTPRSWGTEKEPMHNDPMIDPETGNIKVPKGRVGDNPDDNGGLAGKLPK